VGSPPSEPGHHGINIMGERARRLGGHVSLLPRAGGGTSVVLCFPAPEAMTKT